MQVVYRARTRKHSSVSRGPEPLTQQPQPPEYLGAAKKITRSLAAPRPHTAILGACGGHRFPGCCPNPVHFPQARNDVLGTGDFLRRLPPWTNGSGSWSWALLRGRAPFSLVFWRVLRLQNPSPPSGPPSFSPSFLPPSLLLSFLPPSIMTFVIRASVWLVYPPYSWSKQHSLDLQDCTPSSFCDLSSPHEIQ